MMRSTRAFVHMGILYRKVKINRGISHCALVLPSIYIPTATS